MNNNTAQHFEIEGYTYEEWSDFVFQHEATENVIPEWWYLDPLFSYSCNESECLKMLIKLYNSTNGLLPKYSFAQIELGFLFVSSAEGFLRFLLNEQIALSLRLASISQMAPLFEKFFALHKKLAPTCLMWWESIFTYGTYGDRTFSDAFELKDEILKLLNQQKESQHEICREAALIGFKHIPPSWKRNEKGSV